MNPGDKSGGDKSGGDKSGGDESGGDEEGGEVGKESVRENLEGDESAGSCDNNDHGNFERLMNLHQAKSHYT